MPPPIDKWGRSGWQFIHSCAWAYPDHPADADRRDMAAFLRAVGKVLPCRTCRRHYEAYLAAHMRASALASRESLTRFLVAMHNDVNLRLGKPLMRYEDACGVYGQGEDAVARSRALAAILILSAIAIAVCVMARRNAH